MDERAERVVNRSLRREFGIERGREWEPGLHLIPETAGKREASVFAFADTAWVRGPEPLLDRLRSVPGLTPASVVDPATWESFAGVWVDRAPTPTVHASTDEAPDAADASGVSDATFAAVAELRTVVSPGEWRESGFGGPVDAVFELVEGGRVSAAANLTDWAGVSADVGVLVHPEARGRGLAVAVGAAATRCAVHRYGCARWRAFETNRASLAVARRLGFTEYGRSMVVRFTS